MNYNQLGASDLRVSMIGFGCMSLGAGEAQGVDILHQAFEKGINFFDTADIYHNGANEVLVGKALRNIRSRVIIATKVGNVLRKDGSGLDWNPSRKHILDSIEGSLKRLQTDYIDLYQLHGGTIADPIEETIETFELLKKQGKIRHYGISSIRPNVIRDYVQRSSIITVMMQYSLLDRRPEEECFGLLHKHGIGVLTRGSIAQGLLAGKAPKPYLDRDEEDVRQAAHAIDSLSGAERSPAQTAIRYALYPQAVASAVVGIRTKEQLQEMAGVPSTPPLSGDNIKWLSSRSRQDFYNMHR